MADTTTLSCAVCFMDLVLGEVGVECADPDCTAVTCVVCIQHLIKHSETEKLIPKCPSQDCTGYFIKSGLRTLPQEVMDSYNLACIAALMKESGEEVEKIIAEKNLILNLRKERMEFINASFPKAISLVANITFKSKIAGMEKVRKKMLNTKLENSNRRCLSSTCNGFLDADWTCMTCTASFCDKCEKKYALQSNHVCNQADIDSLKLISTFIKCPGCKLPVFKNEGCNYITCSNCGTNFEYKTGQKANHGSTNVKISVDMSTRKKISYLYKEAKGEDQKILDLLLRIESCEPSATPKEILLSPLKEYYEWRMNMQNDKEENFKFANEKKLLDCAGELGGRLHRYIRSKYRNKLYFRTISEIEDKIRLLTTVGGEGVSVPYLKDLYKKVDELMKNT